MNLSHDYPLFSGSSEDVSSCHYIMSVSKKLLNEMDVLNMCYSEGTSQEILH